MIKKLKNFFPVCWQDFVVLVVVTAVAVDVCLLVQSFDRSDTHAALIFVLAVLIISFYTTGYLWGICASLFSVFAVNYAFSYPYFSFSFSIAGSPLTVATMFAVSLTTCAFTSTKKDRENIRVMGERERMRSNLLRGIGHDLRTPLTYIAGAINVIIDDESSIDAAKQRELLLGIREESEWLIRMVENLLSVTRVDADAAQIVKSPALAEELIEVAVGKFTKRFPHIKVDAKVPNEMVLVLVDEVLIEQVLFNLMENAVIHGNADELVLSVTVNDKMAQFCVADNGCGISAEVLPYLFEDYFYRITRDPKQDMKQNLGIGLSVCMTIMQAHGCELYAKNKESGGALFGFTLPLGKE